MILPAAVQFYDVVVFFHIAAVVLAFGPTFAYPVFFSVAARTNPAALATVGRGVLTWDRTAGTLGMLLILVTGLYLTSDRWDFGDFFVSWGFAAIILLFGVVHGFFIPNARRYVQAVEAGREDEAQAVAGRLNVMGPIAGLAVILTIYVMTAKPFL